MSILVLLPVLSATATLAPAGPSEGEVWKLRLQLPVVSGFNQLLRDAPPASPAVSYTPRQDVILAGASLARQWGGRWTVEGHAAYALEDPLIRSVVGLRGGRYFTLRDRREVDGRGGVVILAPLGGVTYRGRGHNWLRGNGDNGQLSIALTAALALDYTYFTSPRWGWTFRARVDSALVVHQAGPPIWRDPEGATYADGYRGHLGLGFDLGVAL